MKLIELKNIIDCVLDRFYSTDIILLERNLSERCMVHRIANYLEQENFYDYFVDCEYNKSYFNNTVSSKVVSNIHGNYIDIVISKRADSSGDLACFEIKKFDNYKGREKDRQNLKILTKGLKFDYDFGFYIILGRRRDEVVIEIYKAGRKVD